MDDKTMSLLDEAEPVRVMRLDGRACWVFADGTTLPVVAGGAVDDKKDDKKDDDDSGEDDEDDDDLDDLLDEDDEEDEDEDSGKDDKAKGKAKKKDPSGDLIAAIAGLGESIKASQQAISDRTVNAVLKEMRGKKDDGKGKDDAKEKDEGPKVDVRIAKAEVRDVIDAAVKLTPEERVLAMKHASALITAGATTATDESELAKRAGAETVELITGLRKLYTRQTVAKLKRRGALKDKEGISGKKDDRESEQASMKAGAELAKALLGKTAEK